MLLCLFRSNNRTGSSATHSSGGHNMQDFRHLTFRPSGASNYRHQVESWPAAPSFPKDATRTRPRRRKDPINGHAMRNCRVSQWSEWTTCSKLCGVGEMHRYRRVLRHGKRGGRPCPPLKQSKWCSTVSKGDGCQRLLTTPAIPSSSPPSSDRHYNW